MNMRYTCGLSAAGYLVLVIAGPFAALGYGNSPEIYGIYTWPLLLGWLAGAAFQFSATFCFLKATLRKTRWHLPVSIILFLFWAAAAYATLVLFETAGQHGAVNPWSYDAWHLGDGIKLSFAIVLCTSLVPALLAIYFWNTQSRGLFTVYVIEIAWQIVATATFVGLFICIWLDWTVGLDLNLRYRNKNAVAIEHGLQWAILLAWTSCIALVVSNVIAIRVLKQDTKHALDQR